MLDHLRTAFPYIVAVALPLAGVIIAVVRHTQGDRDEGMRIAVAALLGMFLYGLFVF